MRTTRKHSIISWCWEPIRQTFLISVRVICQIRFGWNSSSWIAWRILHGKQQQTFLDNQFINKIQERQRKWNHRCNPWAENKSDGWRVEQENGTVASASRTLGCWTVFPTTRICLQAARGGLQGMRAYLPWMGKNSAKYQRAELSFRTWSKPLIKRDMEADIVILINKKNS